MGFGPFALGWRFGAQNLPFFPFDFASFYCRFGRFCRPEPARPPTGSFRISGRSVYFGSAFAANRLPWGFWAGLASAQSYFGDSQPPVRSSSARVIF
ncbi:hypothetical protein EBZ70_03045 [bacterium]|nr:hypothetical protein [bacterium]